MTKNEIAYQANVETRRANLAREKETNRANLASEELKGKELVETNRHNLVWEGETQRHNLSTEGETSRHNQALEALQAAQIQLGYGNLSLGYSNLFEATRAHDLQDAQYYAGLEKDYFLEQGRQDRFSQEQQQQNTQFYDKYYLDTVNTAKTLPGTIALAVGGLLKPFEETEKVGKQYEEGQQINKPQTKQGRSPQSGTFIPKQR